MAFGDENMGDIRPVYAPKDFMEVLTSLSSPNYTAKIYDHSDVNERSGTSVWGLIQVKSIRGCASMFYYYNRVNLLSSLHVRAII